MVNTPVFLLPADEDERLQSLRQYDIVHSLQEDLFDELVALTASLFRLPISYVGLVEAQQIHYKATYGFVSPGPQPRATLLCALVVKRNRVVIYHDLATTPQTRLDTLAIQNCLAQQARFYVGAPLRMPDERTIGTLCLVGPQPREFSAEEQEMLEAIAAIVSQAIVVRSLCRLDPYVGEERWQAVRTQARDEVYALGALIRYLATRYGTATPVPEEILQPVRRRLHDLRAILLDY